MAPMIGIYGGTFDPVHFGHLRAALEAAEQLGLDELRMLPAGQPPLRDAPQATAPQRLEMLRLAVAGRPGFTVDDRELRRDGPSFTVDTLDSLRAELGSAPLVLCIGQDAANGLDRWHEWRRLFELAHLAVLRRPDAHSAYGDSLRREMLARRVDDPRVLRDAPAGKVLPLAITQLDISATAIRRLVAAGRSPDFLLPAAVAAYIRDHALYRPPFAGRGRTG
jgi:nicotinate-nucleotide adenylyltransferase